ncbi:ribosomal protein S6, putative [Leishmania tarentolae]|uniref:Ribosomal protein S6, putative n=1 Tax=Leishmania tarentolae TaxID=5689 RepID=A0A640KHU9_LEITA|nr:ribosomal protein S6, putative [Leishmania tarentolae]
MSGVTRTAQLHILATSVHQEAPSHGSHGRVQQHREQKCTEGAKPENKRNGFTASAQSRASLTAPSLQQGCSRPEGWLAPRHCETLATRGQVPSWTAQRHTGRSCLRTRGGGAGESQSGSCHRPTLSDPQYHGLRLWWPRWRLSSPSSHYSPPARDRG